ncbi:MAG: ATP-binding protein, partial [Thermodesulfovibrionales bacterium]
MLSKKIGTDQMGTNVDKLRLKVQDIFTSGMYDRCEPAVLYKFMMLNLALSLGTPFVLGFGLFDIYRGIEPLGYIITTVGFTCAASFYFLRRTKNYIFVGYLVVFVIFWMFLYLLATGGSGNSGVLWYYSFPPIVLFLMGFRKGSVVVLTSLLVSGVILFWPGTPYLSASYSPDIRIRFIPSVVVLWAITSLFEHIMAAALKIEIKNNELREHIEERKQAEKALVESEEVFRSMSSQFNALLDAIPDNIFLMSPDLKMLWVNKAAAAGANKKVEEMVGNFCYPLWHNNGIPCDPCPALRSFSSGQPASDIITAFDGRSLELRTIPVKKDGKVVSVIKVARDITEQRSLEEQLRHSQKMESVGTLAGGIAHDFNNILSAIIGYGDLVLMKMAKDDHLRPKIKQIRAAADKAAYLTQGLLAFSRKQLSNKKQVDLNEHIIKTEDFFRTAIGEEIRFRINLHEHPIPVYADPNQIEQVLMNLITNARDAMPAGGDLTVTTAPIRLDEEFSILHGYGNPGRYGLITVSDSGTGMDEETRRRIFEPFFTTK